MQAPGWAVRFFGWRWMPSVALVSGSFAFVLIAVAIVPDDFGAVASGTDRVMRGTRSRLGTNASSTLEATSSGDEESVRAAGGQRRAAPADVGAGSTSPPGNVVHSIFHSAPKIDLPVEPVDPTPEPPPPSPPPPAPTATIFTLESPPPAAPPPEPPAEPQGVTGQ